MPPSTPSVTDDPKKPKGGSKTNVFGKPVTDDTVKKLFPGKGKITNRDRAYVAYNLKNEDKKEDLAVDYAVRLKYDGKVDADKVATVCVIYNATGVTIELFKQKDFNGGTILDPGYPSKIENGQWAAFLHVGSHAAVVYRGQNELHDCAWLHAWQNLGSDQRKSVCTEIQTPDHYEDDDVLTSLKSLTNRDKDTWNTGIGCYSYASIDQVKGFPDKYTGIMTLEAIPPSPPVTKYSYD
ncbi:23 kDa jasmonate-induced protein-like [Ziziphus jujuba]|uniref:23 kDa jasmonate-induced protein-like n=1 Tax=Ziziphus jujuba TaxID=326968 RepID=A0A6P3YVU6_ZIZJJ|nr:23 kDa jasmonate-induced protein-like [Ziziphus jujuba]XP_060675359.1 23 kDa jasmonate-induced protein-like [Ziziphus jujuba]